jgi:hypothetical protein
VARYLFQLTAVTPAGSYVRLDSASGSTTPTAVSPTDSAYVFPGAVLRSDASTGALPTVAAGVATLYQKTLSTTGTVTATATLTGTLVDGAGPGALEALTFPIPVNTDPAGLSASATPLASNAAFTGTYASVTTMARYPVGNYASVQAAINAVAAAGGGVVALPAGPTPVSATLQMKSKVILSGPDSAWTVWGYNSGDPTQMNEAAWLVADGSSGAVIEFASTIVGAGVRNLMVYANGRRGINILGPSTRGGNHLRDVYVNGGGDYGIYAEQLEVRMRDIYVTLCTGDGIYVIGQDSDLDKCLTGYNHGNGLVLGANSGPLIGRHIDSFHNDLDGIVINGYSHRLTSIQVNHNGRRGVRFADTTHSQIMHLVALNNGREYTGTGGFTTRYPDVLFAHSTAGNDGCGVVGGFIVSDDGLQSYAAQSTEVSVGFAFFDGVSFKGTYNGGGSPGSSPFQLLSSLNVFQTRNCRNLPDLVVVMGGTAGIRTRNNGSADQIQWTNGSGTAYGGMKATGAFYQAVKSQTLAANGAVTIDASSGNYQQVTLQANATSSTISNATAGEHMTVAWIQDATGSRTYAWPSNCKFVGGVAPTASTTAAYRDSVTFIYDGTNWLETARAVGVR